jgi:regulator of RNase E activity RraA
VIAPACTLKLVSKDSPPESTPPAENAIPKGSHWVDLTEPGSIVVIDQPEGQKCAAVGGIMAQRMKKRGVAGCIIGGRVRDMAELKSSQLPVCLYLDSHLSSCLLMNSLHFDHKTDIFQIFALGKSTVGTGAESTVYARNVPVSISGVTVSPVRMAVN